MTRALSRGLAVLETLARADEPGLGPSAIAERADLDKATVTRLLRTLVAAQYVAQDATTRRYRLTGRILSLAHGATIHLDLRSLARPHLTALRDELGETVHLGVMDDLRVVYVDKLEAANSIQLVSAIGQTMPLHSTALGKAMLAALPEAERDAKLARMDLTRRTDRTIGDVTALREEIERTRARGYAIDDRENEPHGACVGAAILGTGGRPVGAISISGPHFRIRDRLDCFGERARHVAGVITRELGAGDGFTGEGSVAERRGAPTSLAARAALVDELPGRREPATAAPSQPVGAPQVRS